MAGKSIKLEIGSVYKKTPKGKFFYRYQINEERKAVCLKTTKQDEAIDKAKKLIPVIKASTLGIVAEHVTGEILPQMVKSRIDIQKQ